jgi:HK97 family phage major capsid protein
MTGIVPSLNSASRFVSLGTATAVKQFAGSSTELAQNTLSPQTLVAMVQAVDPAYYPDAAFYMNTAQALGIRSLVDANGRPLYNLDDGLSQGTGGSLLGFPVRLVAEIPNLVASTTGGPIFGSVANAMQLRTVPSQVTAMRLTERYAEFLQVGYIGANRVDSVPLDLASCVTVKPAAT